tara:strand:+ start:1511 stop:2614 length:1104 start_codon:yes stop_codon:yes gene_type:complete
MFDKFIKAPKVIKDSLGIVEIPVAYLLKKLRIGKYVFDTLRPEQQKIANMLYNAKHPEKKQSKGLKLIRQYQSLFNYILLSAASVLAATVANLTVFSPLIVNIAIISSFVLIALALMEVGMRVYYRSIEHKNIKSMQDILKPDPDHTMSHLMCVEKTLEKNTFKQLKSDIRQRSNYSNISEALVHTLKEVYNEIDMILFQSSTPEALTPLQTYLASQVAYQASLSRRTTVRSDDPQVKLFPQLTNVYAQEAWNEYLTLREQAIHMQKILGLIHRKQQLVVNIISEDSELADLLTMQLSKNKKKRCALLYKKMVTLEKTLQMSKTNASAKQTSKPASSRAESPVTPLVFFPPTIQQDRAQTPTPKSNT